MFNRNNFPSVNPFGSGGGSGSPAPGGDRTAPPRDRYNSPNQQSPGHGPDPRLGGGYASPLRRPDSDSDTVMTDGFDDKRNYDRSPMGRGPPQQYMPSRQGPDRISPRGGGGGGMDDQVWSLRPAKSPDNSYTYGNL